MIELQNLCFSFGEKVIFKDLDMSLPTGKTTCILGPSGRGKTTLLSLLMGLLKPEKGEISGLPSHPAAVFQEDRLCEDFSAVANIRAVTSLPKREIESCLKELGIADFSSPVRTFSGGMKRRVAIARALCYGGDCLIMDEPFKGLDGERKNSVMAAVRERTKGKTVIFVTHDPSEAAALEAQTVSL